MPAREEIERVCAVPFRIDFVESFLAGGDQVAGYECHNTGGQGWEGRGARVEEVQDGGVGCPTAEEED